MSSVLPVVSPRSFTARDGLLRLAGLATAGAVLAGAGALGYGLACPWRTLTGTLCPVCGGTHLGMALLAGDLPGAFAANPFLFVLLVGVGLLGSLWTIEALGGPAVRPPRRLSRKADRWWLALGVLAVAWAVLRNIW